MERTNDRVKKLLEQLKKVQSALEQLSKVDIKNKDRAIFQVEARKEKIGETIISNKAIFEPLGYIDISNFETKNSNLLSIDYANFETSRKNFQAKNSEAISDLNTQKQQNEREVIIRINSFKRPAEEITSKFKDWRSDVSALPDSTNLEFINEYQKFLERLEKDNLPKFEKKFNDYLQETITNKVGDFRMFFENWSDSIKENIKHLNDSLKEIDFKNNPKTYIQLVAPNKINDEVKEFRSLLNAAIPNIRGS